MFSRNMVRVGVSVLLLAVVGVFSQLCHQSAFQVKHSGTLAVQTLDQRVLKTDGGDPPPACPPKCRR
jgi:hypothetical protein